jgi:hypothetical protein
VTGLLTVSTHGVIHVPCHLTEGASDAVIGNEIGIGDRIRFEQAVLRSQARPKCGYELLAPTLRIHVRMVSMIGTRNNRQES